MRERVFWVFLVVLLLDVVVISSIIPCVRINSVQAQPIPNLTMDPPEIVDPLLSVGQEFTVSLNISNAEGSSVDGLFGAQVKISFNMEVVNCTDRTKITPGGFWEDWFPSDWTFQRFIDYNQGYALIAGSQRAPYEGGAYGDGILAYITFTVVADQRGSLLQYASLSVDGGTFLRTAVSGVLTPIEPFTTQDGIFDNRQPQTNVSPVAAFEYRSMGTQFEGGRFVEGIEFNASASYDPDAWLERYDWNYGDGTSESYIYTRNHWSNVSTAGFSPPIVDHAYDHAGIYRVTLVVRDNDDATATLAMDVQVPGHDIAITDVQEPYLAVMPGTFVPISVNVSNNGNYTETFDVNVYFNETLVETKNIIDMPAYSETTLTYTWNTTEVALGKYVLKANASEVAGGIYTTNNAYTDGTVTVASSNLVQFQTTIAGRVFIVQVDSTSIAADFQFSRTEKRMNFTLAGALGWFSNVTVPMALLNVTSPSAWIVKLNGSNTAYSATSNGTHYFIYFSYVQSVEPYTVDIFGETVATPPNAFFTASKTTALAEESVTFDASTSYDPDGTVQSWSWTFGDGGVGTGEIVQHPFATNGTYTVTLTIKDNHDLANSTQTTMTVIDYPVAGFSYLPSEPLVNQTINFDAATSNPVGGTITGYSWEFGDGLTGTGRTTSHSYSTTGTFTVNLTVTDSEGLTNSTTKTVTVKIHDIALASLTATPSTVRMGETVTIQLTVENNGNFTESFSVTVYYQDAATDVTIETKSVPNLAGGSSQPLTVQWNTANIGPKAYTIKAETSDVLGETRTDDNTIADVVVTVQKKISSLTVDVSSTTVTLGSSASLRGTLTPALQGKTITLQYRLVGQTWSTLNTLTTDAQSRYLFLWTPTSAGTYEIQATWQGDANTEAGQSQIQTITVKEAETAQGIPMQYIIIALVAAIAIIAIVIYLFRVRK